MDPTTIIRSNWPSNTFNLTQWQFEFIDGSMSSSNPNTDIPGFSNIEVYSITVITSPNGHNPQFRMRWFPDLQPSRMYYVRTRPKMYQGPTWGDWEPFTNQPGGYLMIFSKNEEFWPLQEQEDDGMGETAVSSPHAHSNVYPNPASGEVSIQFMPAIADNQVDLSIFDMSGREVYRTVYGVDGGTTQRLIYDAGALANGTYLIHIKTNTTESTEKLVVRR